jgi:Flp pilus assembly protein CpaB
MSLRTVVVVLGVVTGVSAVLLVGIVSNQNVPQPERGPGRPKTTPILVAAVDVARGAILKPELLRMRPWPVDLVPAGALPALSSTTAVRSSCSQQFYRSKHLSERRERSAQADTRDESRGRHCYVSRPADAV